MAFRIGRRGVFLALLAGTCLALPACTTNVATTGPGAPLAGGPRPRRILVENFPVDWSGERLDTSIGATLRRSASGEDPQQEAVTIAREVQEAIAETLARRISATGLPVFRVAPGSPATPGDVILQGRITTINQGNRTRRTLIGFGAGQSVVQADAELLRAGRGGAPRLLQSYVASSDSGRRPGLGIGAAAGAASGHIATAAGLGAADTAAGAHRSEVAQEATRLANHLADDITQLFATEGWIAPAAAPP